MVSLQSFWVLWGSLWSFWVNQCSYGNGRVVTIGTMASLGSGCSKPSCSGDKRKYSSGDSDEETRETVSILNLFTTVKTNPNPVVYI